MSDTVEANVAPVATDQPRASKDYSKKANPTATSGNQDVSRNNGDKEKSKQDSKQPTKKGDDDDDKHCAGTKLGHYIIGKSLGKGTFGKVK